MFVSWNSATISSCSSNQQWDCDHGYIPKTKGNKQTLLEPIRQWLCVSQNMWGAKKQLLQLEKYTSDLVKPLRAVLNYTPPTLSTVTVDISCIYYGLFIHTSKHYSLYCTFNCSLPFNIKEFDFTLCCLSCCPHFLPGDSLLQTGPPGWRLQGRQACWSLLRWWCLNCWTVPLTAVESLLHLGD